MRKLAGTSEIGMPNSQLYVELCYEKGRGVMQDHEKAARWFQKAVDQGDAHACQYSLGVVFANDQEVKQSDKEAAQWYQKAADQADEAFQKA